MPSSQYYGNQLSKEIIKFCLRKIHSGISSRTDLVDKACREFKSHDKSRVRDEARRNLSYMKSRGYIKENRDRLNLTDKGAKRLQKMQMSSLELESQKWDGKWRILTFDIPEDRRPARNAVRRLIKQLGFQPLHKSVWVHPTPCGEHIQQIKDAYGVGEHITLLEVTSFDQEAKFEKVFKDTIKATS